MTDDLDQLRERVRQNRESLSDELRQPAPKGSTPADPVRSTPVAGDRVLDRITGREGIVEPSSGIHAVKGTLIPVRFSNGHLVLRPAEELVVRPTPPAAP